MLKLLETYIHFIEINTIVDAFCFYIVYLTYLIIFASQTVVQELLQKYSITVNENQDLSHKWLPVSRPKAEVKVKLRKRSGL